VRAFLCVIVTWNDGFTQLRDRLPLALMTVHHAASKFQCSSNLPKDSQASTVRHPEFQGRSYP